MSTRPSCPKILAARGTPPRQDASGRIGQSPRVTMDFGTVMATWRLAERTATTSAAKAPLAGLQDAPRLRQRFGRMMMVVGDQMPAGMVPAGQLRSLHARIEDALDDRDGRGCAIVGWKFCHERRACWPARSVNSEKRRSTFDFCAGELADSRLPCCCSRPDRIG